MRISHGRTKHSFNNRSYSTLLSDRQQWRALMEYGTLHLKRFGSVSRPGKFQLCIRVIDYTVRSGRRVVGSTIQNIEKPFVRLKMAMEVWKSVKAYILYLSKSREGIVPRLFGPAVYGIMTTNLLHSDNPEIGPSRAVENFVDGQWWPFTLQVMLYVHRYTRKECVACNHRLVCCLICTNRFDEGWSTPFLYQDSTLGLQRAECEASLDNEVHSVVSNLEGLGKEVIHMQCFIVS